MADLEGSNRKLGGGGGKLLLKELKGLFFLKKEKKNKTNQARLARWFSSEELRLFLQKTQVQFSASILMAYKHLSTPAPQDLMASGLRHWIQDTTPSPTYTHKLKIKVKS